MSMDNIKEGNDANAAIKVEISSNNQLGVLRSRGVVIDAWRQATARLTSYSRDPKLTPLRASLGQRRSPTRTGKEIVQNEGR